MQKQARERARLEVCKLVHDLSRVVRSNKLLREKHCAKKLAAGDEL